MLMSTECPKCQGVLEEGFMPDRPDDKVFPAIWVEGNPGYKEIEKKGRKYRIQSYRCMSCGYMESYAEMSAE